MENNTSKIVKEKVAKTDKVEKSDKRAEEVSLNVSPDKVRIARRDLFLLLFFFREKFSGIREMFFLRTVDNKL